MGGRILYTQKACRLRTYLLVGLVALRYVAEEQLHDFLEDFGLDACCGQSGSIGHCPLSLFLAGPPARNEYIAAKLQLQKKKKHDQIKRESKPPTFFLA
jgi:hypothetical protein